MRNMNRRQHHGRLYWTLWDSRISTGIRITWIPTTTLFRGRFNLHDLNTKLSGNCGRSHVVVIIIGIIHLDIFKITAPPTASRRRIPGRGPANPNPDHHSSGSLVGIVVNDYTQFTNHYTEWISVNSVNIFKSKIPIKGVTVTAVLCQTAVTT